MLWPNHMVLRQGDLVLHPSWARWGSAGHGCRFKSPTNEAVWALPALPVLPWEGRRQGKQIHLLTYNKWSTVRLGSSSSTTLLNRHCTVTVYHLPRTITASASLADASHARSKFMPSGAKSGPISTGELQRSGCTTRLKTAARRAASTNQEQMGDMGSFASYVVVPSLW